MAILEANNITVVLGQQEILQRLCVCIQAGKRIAVIGPNGSGKSTLLKALAGLLHLAAGEVLFDGQAIQAYGKKALARKLAILPQGSIAPNDLTVAELVEYGRFPYRSWWGGDRAEDNAAIEEALCQTGLQAMKERVVNTLSGGERQRAWIAMALAQRPTLLMLDEPTTYLDISHQLEVMQIVSDLNKQAGISVMMVLHDLNQAMQYADEIIVMKEGKIFAQGRADEVIDLKLLQNVFQVGADIFQNKNGKQVFIPTKLKI